MERPFGGVGQIAAGAVVAGVRPFRGPALERATLHRKELRRKAFRGFFGAKERPLRMTRGRVSRRRASIPWCTEWAYSGMFPCFFGGFFSRLVCYISRASINPLRVSLGWMTAST